VVAALLEKRSILAADLAVAEEAVTCLRRQITAVSETLKTFGHLEPERDRMPAAVRHKRSKEGFRKGELTRRVLEDLGAKIAVGSCRDGRRVGIEAAR
jgi:hypothetical protein